MPPPLAPLGPFSICDEYDNVSEPTPLPFSANSTAAPISSPSSATRAAPGTPPAQNTNTAQYEDVDDHITLVSPCGASLLVHPQWTTTVLGELIDTASIAWGVSPDSIALHTSDARPCNRNTAVCEVCHPGECLFVVPSDPEKDTQSPFSSEEVPRRVSGEVRSLETLFVAFGAGTLDTLSTAEIERADAVVKAAGMLDETAPLTRLLPLLFSHDSINHEILNTAEGRELLKTAITYFPHKVMELLLRRHETAVGVGGASSCAVFEFLLRSTQIVHISLGLSTTSQKARLLKLVIKAINTPVDGALPRVVVQGILSTARLECPAEVLQMFEGCPLQLPAI